MLPLVRSRLTPTVLLLLLLNVPVRAQSLPKVELSKRGKAATALIELKARTTYAAAFCVHPSGLFLTAEQVVRQRGEGDTVTLVLDPGLQTQQVHKAKVARTDAELNLALLRVEGREKLPSLPLGTAADLTELLELVAFGFPAGQTVGEGEYPSLTVRSASITSLQRKAGEPVRVQLDTALDAGYSGGVVLDPQGRAAGVVVGGAGATAVIPPNQVARFLAQPDVLFTPAAVTAANRGQPQLFEVRATSPVPSETPLEVELTLRAEDGKERKHRLERSGDVYRVKTAPALPGQGPLRLHLDLTFADGAVTGSVEDRKFSIGETALSLSEVRSIRFGAKALVTRQDGKELAGMLAGLDFLDVRLDETPIRVQLAEAIEAHLEAPQGPAPVAYTLVVTRGGKEVARLTGELGTLAAAPPAASVAGIRPPTLPQEEVVVALPAAQTDVCVGGGGRYLIFHLATLRKLAIFDVNEAKVIQYLPAGEDGLKMAAGLDRLIVALPASNVLQRWSLTTFEREVAVPCPVPGPVRALAMGSASRGPLVVAAGGAARPGLGSNLVFLDPGTFKESDYQFAEQRGFYRGNIDPGRQDSGLRVSADGQLVTGAGVFVRDGKTYKLVPEAPSNALPGPDGRYLYTTGRLYTADGKPVGQPVGRHGQMSWFFPAHHGPYYVSLNEQGHQGNAIRFNVGIHVAGDTRPLVTLANIEGLTGLMEYPSGQHPPFDRHVFYIPGAQLLIVIPRSNDRLVLHRVDIDALLDKAGVDYLFVQSQPPAHFKVGSRYSYPMVVRSRKGGVRYKLESGPRGMTVAADGKLTWDVPRDLAEAQVAVILTISDATGQEVFHSFKVSVSDKAEAPHAVQADTQSKPDPKPLEPKSAVEIKPPAGPAEQEPAAVKPAPLKADREERPLPSAVADACVGGGGRFFILHLPNERKLAVFDVNEARVVKYLSVADDHVKFAAGLNRLFVVFPDKGVIQRFSLATFEKEVTAQLPLRGTVKAIVTGSAAAGPLLVHSDGAGVAFLDPVTFQELDFGVKDGRAWPHGDSDHYRASPDGTVFAGWITRHSQSMSSIVLAGKTAKVYGGEMAGIVVPGADNTLVTAGGLYTSECKPLGSDKAEPRYRLRVPSQTGRFYLSCPGGGGAQLNTGVGDVGKPVTVYLMGDARPIITLTDVELPVSNEAWTRNNFTQDKRVLFVPEGNLIAIIPKSNDRLVLHRVDLDEALEKAGVDYLFVLSRPPAVAYKGTQLAYTPRVKSKKGGVKLRLESGPDGMSVTADGKLTWNVPANFAAEAVDVILTVSDASGQEVFHTFKIAVKEKGAE